MNLNFKSITFEQTAKSRAVWIGLLFCWLLIANIATLHQQKHLLANDFECQYCVSSFSNTPVIAADELTISAKQSFYFSPIATIDSLLISEPIELNSRGPPQALV